MTTLIRNGTVVSATGSHRIEVLVDGQTIAALLQPGSDAAASAETGADFVIDATGKYVVPGGIDGHTHMELHAAPSTLVTLSLSSSPPLELWLQPV